MRSRILTLLLILNLAAVPKLFSQNVSINATGNLPDTSAMLDVSSTTKGFLLPRMTTAQQNAIVLPATGLSIFNITTNSFMVNVGTPASPVWTAMVTSQTTTDTTNIANFSVKVRSLFSANAPIIYSNGKISADTTSAITGLATKYNISQKGRVDSIRMLNTGVVFNNPGAFYLAGNTGVITQTLAIQSPYTVFGRAIGTGVPSFLTSLDSNWIPDLHSEKYYNTRYQSLNSSWATLGNSGTNPSTNFLGTTDNNSLRFKTNGAQGMLLDSLGNVSVGTVPVFSATNPEKLLVDAASGSYNVISGKGNLNSFLQLNIKNTNSGTVASSDLVATNDAGTEANGLNYVDMGINSSGNTSTGVTGGANTGYLYSTGSDFAIGNASASKNLLLFTGGTTAANERMRIDGNGNVGIGTTAPEDQFHVVLLATVSGQGAPVDVATIETVGATSNDRSNPPQLNLVRQVNPGFYAPGSTPLGPVINFGIKTSGTRYNFAQIRTQTKAANSSIGFLTRSGMTDGNPSGGTLAEVMTLNGTNLGIGTTTPSTALHVVGTNPLTLIGVQTGTNTSTDSILTITGGTVKKLPAATFATTAAAISSLNGLTTTTQAFATGNTGTDFNIASSGSTHTFNIPDASATARGALTTGTQTIAGNKTLSGNSTFSGSITASTLNSGVSTDSVVTVGTTGVLNKRNVADLLNGMWATKGNAGTNPLTNFLGTNDAKDLVFKTNSTERMRIVDGVSAGTGTSGNVVIGDTTSGSITTNKELVLREDGDQFGPSTLHLRNRPGENGAIFETIGAGSGAYLVDFIFRTGISASPIGSNIRFETRASNQKVSGNTTEWQFGQPDAVNGGPTLIVGAFGTGSNSAIAIGNFGIGTTSPTQKLDVNGNIKFSGALMPNNAAGSVGNFLTSTGPGSSPIWSVLDTANIAGFSTKVRSLFSATAPVTYTNGVIGITQASTSTNGYLSSTDWNTFNNKASATNTWSTLGNAGTTSSNFIGTTDNTSLLFKTNSLQGMTIDNNQNVGIGTSPSFSISNPEKLLVDAGATGNTNYQNVVVGRGNTNSYAQLNIQNGNAGTAASSDVVATANNGNELANFIDMGINSSVNTSTGVIGGINTGYLYTTANDFAIGNATSGKSLLFFTGGTGTTERMRIDGNGRVGIGTTTPNSTLQATGSVSMDITTQTTTYTATASNHTIICNNAAAMTVALPTAVGITGRIYVIKKISGVSGTTLNVTIDPAGSQTIDAVLTKVLTTQYSQVTIQSDGANWFILSN